MGNPYPTPPLVRLLEKASALLTRFIYPVYVHRAVRKKGGGRERETR